MINGLPALRREAFFGAKSKVERAYKHIAELEEWFAGYLKACPYPIWMEAHPQTGHPSMLVGTTFRNLPSGGPQIIGDAVHNLRSALDYVAHETARAAGTIPDSHLHFPIDKNRKSLEGQRHYRAIEGASPDVAKIIADLQEPYGAGNRLLPLNKLDRMDKHTLLIPTVFVAEVRLQAIEDDDNPPPFIRGTLWCVGGEPARMVRRGSRADLDNQRNNHAPVEICFGQGQPAAGEPVIPTLHEFAQLVRRVIDTLEAHCFGEDAHARLQRLGLGVQCARHVLPADSAMRKPDATSGHKGRIIPRQSRIHHTSQAIQPERIILVSSFLCSRRREGKHAEIFLCHVDTGRHVRASGVIETQQR